MAVALKVNVSVGQNLKTLSIYAAQAMSEIAEAVGCNDCQDTLKKGIVQQHIIKSMKLRFMADKNGQETIVGELILTIDWERAEVLATGSLAQELRNNFADNNALIPRVTNGLLSFLRTFTEKMKRERGVKYVRSNYEYRSEYSKGDKYSYALNFLNHVTGTNYPRDTTDLNNELEMELSAFRGMLTLKTRY
jgi:hypothetical protein